MKNTQLCTICTQNRVHSGDFALKSDTKSVWGAAVRPCTDMGMMSDIDVFGEMGLPFSLDSKQALKS